MKRSKPALDLDTRFQSSVAELVASLPDETTMRGLCRLLDELRHMRRKEEPESRPQPKVSPCRKKAFDRGITLREALEKLKKET